MPAFLLDLLISLALKFGVPWLLSKFPFLPSNLKDILQQLIDDVKKSKDEHKEAVADARSEAKSRIKKECFGVGCAIDTKSL